jgi:hypothetical protein
MAQYSGGPPTGPSLDGGCAGGVLFGFMFGALVGSGFSSLLFGGFGPAALCEPGALVPAAALALGALASMLGAALGVLAVAASIAFDVATSAALTAALGAALAFALGAALAAALSLLSTLPRRTHEAAAGTITLRATSAKMSAFGMRERLLSSGAAPDRGGSGGTGVMCAPFSSPVLALSPVLASPGPCLAASALDVDGCPLSSAIALWRAGCCIACSRRSSAASVSDSSRARSRPGR